MGQPRDSWLERVEAPEIIGEVENPALEVVRRFWWQTLDRVCGCFMSFRLWLFDRIHGAESTPVDLQREADHERLVKALPVAGEAIEPTKHNAV